VRPSCLQSDRVEIEENINGEVLNWLRQIFDATDIDQGGFLDMQEFMNAFQGTSLGIDRFLNVDHVQASL